MNTAEILAELRSREQTLAVAESLTGGALAKTLTDIPGSSKVFLGGVITYSIDSKVAILGLDPDEIGREGVVSRHVAEAMADAVRIKFSSTWSIATTGVAGPGPHEGVAAGEAWIALSGPSSHTLRLSVGDLGREEVRMSVVGSALELLSRILATGKP